MGQWVNRLGMGSLGALVSWWFGLISNAKGWRAVRAFRILVEAVK